MTIEECEKILVDELKEFVGFKIGVRRGDLFAAILLRQVGDSKLRTLLHRGEIHAIGPVDMDTTKVSDLKFEVVV